MPTVAFTLPDRAVADVSRELAGRGLVVGAGLLCAPLAHDALGTAPDGVIRISVGPTTTDAEVDRALEILAGPGPG